ncbi:MAG: hypothetical protein ACYC5N_02660 [Endomicrobiales bacterium]
MMKVSALLLSFLLSACAPLSVHVLADGEFAQFNIPRRITLVPGNDTVLTKKAVRELSASFARAGFRVVDHRAVNAALSGENLTLDILLASFDYRRLQQLTGLEGVVLVRQFYGIELHFVDISGTPRASGCWQTSPIRVVNEVIDQIRQGAPGQGLCPFKEE